MEKIYNLLFAGVGGQGSLLIAELTSLAAADCHYDVKQTEVHGVSQRGGSVETHVRFGPKIFSPIVSPGEADAVIALEKLEALRFAHYIDQAHGVLLVNDYEIIPASVADAEKNYPHQAMDFLLGRGLQVIPIPASKISRDLGDGRVANVVMLGALSTMLPFPEESWPQVLRFRLPQRHLEQNLKAFESGRQTVREMQSVRA